MTRVTHEGQHWSNAEEDRVEPGDYDPRWPAMFDAEAGWLRAVLDGVALGPFSLEYFGSTAVPRIAAKPIIDIVLVVADRSRWPSVIEPLG